MDRPQDCDEDLSSRRAWPLRVVRVDHGQVCLGRLGEKYPSLARRVRVERFMRVKIEVRWEYSLRLESGYHIREC